MISGATGAALPPLSSGGANPGGVFRLLADGYLFNLQTPPDTAGTYVLTITVGTEPRLYGLPFLVQVR